MILCEVCKKREAAGYLLLKDCATGEVDDSGIGPNVCIPCGTEITGEAPPRDWEYPPTQGTHSSS